MESFIHLISVCLAPPGEKSTKEGAGDETLITAVSLKTGSLSKSFIIPRLLFLFLCNEKCELDMC